MQELTKEHIDTINKTEKTVDKIYYALVDDKEMGHTGLITNVKNQDKRIELLEQKQMKKSYLKNGASVGAGFVGGLASMKYLGPILKLFNIF